MAAIPKLLKCYDCDQTFTREEVFGAMEDLVPGYCQHRSVASHTGTLAYRLESVQDFLIKLDIKPLMHLLKISTFSLNNVIVRLTKIMNRADKNWAHFY